MPTEAADPPRIVPAEVEPASRYRLFLRALIPELYCAVPEGFPTPDFLAAGCWALVDLVAADQTAHFGFRQDAAWRGASLNGFHLFFSCSKRPGCRP